MTIYRNMKNLKSIIGTALLSLFVISCSENSEDPTVDGENQSQVITTRLAGFEGSGQAVEGEDKINDMQACLFEKGILTKVYPDLSPSDKEYKLQLESREGNLYMLANTAGTLDLSQMKVGAVSEAEWLKTTFPTQKGRATNFFTGMLTLDKITPESGTQTLTLKRGVARFDIVVKVAGSASIKSLTVTNVAQSAYLFPQQTALSPENVVRKDTTCIFDKALTQDTPMVLYVYEQDNAGMEIKAEVSFEGGITRTLSTPLKGSLKRNTIYTVTIRKDDIDVTVKPSLEDWEQGEDTELAPR